MKKEKLIKVVKTNGTIEYYNKNRELHNTEGPAVIKSNGTIEYWENGKLHRFDEPAIERKDGSFEWWVGGIKHRDFNDEPAISNKKAKRWYYKGLPHRENGPAIEYPNGTCVYYNYGYEITQDQFEKLLLQTKLDRLKKLQ